MKTKLLSLFLLVAAALSLSFTYKEVKSHRHTGNCLIVVGVAYKDKKCTSGATSTFSSAAGYKYMHSANGGYTQMKDEIKSDLSKWYNVDQSDVSVSSAQQAAAVIIKYEKEITGWRCNVTKYAVGYGNTEDEAEASAVRSKNSDARDASYTVVERISCN